MFEKYQWNAALQGQTLERQTQLLIKPPVSLRYRRALFTDTSLPTITFSFINCIFAVPWSLVRLSRKKIIFIIRLFDREPTIFKYGC